MYCVMAAVLAASLIGPCKTRSELGIRQDQLPMEYFITHSQLQFCVSPTVQLADMKAQLMSAPQIVRCSPRHGLTM